MAAKPWWPGTPMANPPFNENWLPVGHFHDLHIEKDVSEDAGDFTGGGWKMCWHTTESPWQAVDAMVNTVQSKRANPHFVIGGRAGRDHPVVVQLVPLNQAGRALENNSGDGFQTNRANVIQVEICGRAAESHTWPDSRYKAFANLFELVIHRRSIVNKAPQDFSNPTRMGDREWVSAKGHVGHSMAPDNNHWDPGRFKEGLLIDLVERIPEEGYDL